MLESGQEEKRRKFKQLDGTLVQLATGEKFCIPSLPLSKEKAKWFIDKMTKFQTFNPREDTLEYFDIGGQMAMKALQLNYNVTDDECDGLFRLAHLPAILSAINGEQQLEKIKGDDKDDKARETEKNS